MISRTRTILLALTLFNAPLLQADLDTTLNPAGTPAGTSTAMFPGVVSQAFGLGVQSDGGIILAGDNKVTAMPDDIMFGLAKFTSTGELDVAGFGAGTGRVTTAFDFSGSTSTDNRARGLVVQTDDKIVVAGFVENPVSAGIELALARYSSTGVLDGSFGPNGNGQVTLELKFTGPATAINSRADSIALQPDGKIVVVGQASHPTTGDIYFAIARYNPDGSLDTTGFNAGGTGGADPGTATAQFGASTDSRARAVAIQASGRIIVVGKTDDAGVDKLAIIGYKADGTPDGAFGPNGDGTITATFSGSSADDALAVAINTADGSDDIYIAGSATVGGAPQFAITKYSGSGTLDATFGTSGYVVGFPGGAASEARGIAIQGTDKVVAVGFSSASGGFPFEFAVARYDTMGILDPTFNTTGSETTLLTGETLCTANGVAITGDKIVAAGYAGTGFVDSGPGDFAVARYVDSATPPTPPATGGLTFSQLLNSKYGGRL